MSVREINLKACAPVILKQIIWPGSGFEPGTYWLPFQLQHTLC